MAFIENNTFKIYHDIASTKKDMSNFFEVDELIAPAIALLNKKGYMTKYCCSGHVFKTLMEIAENGEDIGEIDGVNYDVNEEGEFLEVDVATDVSQSYICFAKKYSLKLLPSGFFYDNDEDMTVIRRNLDSLADTFERMDELVKIAKDLYLWAEEL